MTSFWIKGDDGEEYGPVKIDELREWLRENRIGADTIVRPGGGDAEWKPFQKFPELVALLAEDRSMGAFTGNGLFSLAPYSSRIAAYIVDSLILAGSAILVLSVLNRIVPAAWQIDSAAFAQVLVSDGAPNRAQALFLVGILLVRVAYYTYFHARTGQTPGKRLFGVRVVNSKGLTISYRQAFIRAIGAVFSEMPYFAGYFIIFFTPYRRALHDLLAGTFVIQVRKGK
jgi:uncharacterized RDD family membrane protein YckC